MGLLDSIKKGVSATVHKAEDLTSGAIKNARDVVGKVEDATTDAVEKGARTVGDTFETVKKKVGPVLNTINPWGTGPDKRFDGAMVGKGGQTFPAGTPLSQVPGVEPKGGVRNAETIIYTNGIQTDVAGQSRSLQAIADQTGSRVVGVHNATESFAADGKQVFTDKLKGANPAVDSLADTVYAELKAGRAVHLMGHSQGGLITSRALSDVKSRLLVEDGLSKADAEKLLGKVTCETFGAAAGHYPDGPKYTHNVNVLDPVPTLLGLGPTKWNPLTDGGEGAKLNYFSDSRGGLNLIANHGFEDVYLGHRQVPEAK